jgi:hypothetical protein
MGMESTNLIPNKNNGKCECGCGELTPLSPYTDRKKNMVKGLPKRFINGHNFKSKGKRVWFKNQGRWWVTTRDWTKPESWARVVMMNHLGRALTPSEVVHHINQDSADDRIENLQLFSSNAEHMAKMHRSDCALNMLRWGLQTLPKDVIEKELAEYGFE